MCCRRRRVWKEGERSDVPLLVEQIEVVVDGHGVDYARGKRKGFSRRYAHRAAEEGPFVPFVVIGVKGGRDVHGLDAKEEVAGARGVHVDVRAIDKVSPEGGKGATNDLGLGRMRTVIVPESGART